MKDKLKEFFKNENIEYYSAISYSDCVEISPEIIKREDFVPRSVLVFLLPYYTGEAENISRYAASLDYHIIIKDVSARLGALLNELYPDCKCRAYGDHSPIHESNAAAKCGLGIVGDGGLLINEKYGTYIFIADTVTDIPPEELGCIAASAVKYCTHCGACKKACPTGILSGIGDSCLSAITQRKGELTPSEAALMKKYNTVWGCDICQSVCPYNKNPEKTPIEFFYKERISLLTTEKLNSMSKEEFSRRAFAWRGRKTVERNLEKLGF